MLLGPLCPDRPYADPEFTIRRFSIFKASNRPIVGCSHRNFDRDRLWEPWMYLPTQCAGWHGETQFHSDEDEILNLRCLRAVLHLQVAKRLERALW